MPFNTALSGLAAASTDLRVTGNNIANAATVGFKGSRTEFGDVYASTLLGTGTNSIGSGVEVSAVNQQFDQGVINFTDNGLDLAIDGNGFFIVADSTGTAYTRAGMFGVDDDGFVVSNDGSRLQGFASNENGTISGILGNLQVSTENLQPRQTTGVDLVVNLDASDEVPARYGSTITTEGLAVGQPQGGIADPTPSVVETTGAPLAFDFSVDEPTTISASSAITPFDFSIDRPSAVSAPSSIQGFDFSVNSPSSLTGAGAPIGFDFSNKPAAVTGTTSFVPFDFSGANSATLDVTIAGTPNSGTQTVTLNGNYATINTMITDINGQLAGLDVQARQSPTNGSLLQFVSTVAGGGPQITLDSFAVNGATTLTNLRNALSGISDGRASERPSFDVTVAGGSADGTATVFLDDNITSVATLVSDVRDELSAAGLAVDVREDPLNAGRLQFFSTDDGVASTITVDNFRSSAAGADVDDISSLLRLSEGASSAVPGTGVGVTGSLTQASFDVSISGGSGAGGNSTVTVVLDQNVPNNGLSQVINSINSQLGAAPLPGIDVVARENPNIPGRLQFAATVAGEASTVSIGNFQVSGIAGDQQTVAADLAGALGGISDGATDTSGNNTEASFQVRVSGSSVPLSNQTQTITLDSNVASLQDLIDAIQDDLQASGIGVDVRENPTAVGRLQFYATESGEPVSIEIDPTDSATFGSGVSRANVVAALGGIELGSGGAPGSSNALPDPSGITGTQGSTGVRSQASFDISLTGASSNNGTATINLDTDVNNLSDLITDIRDDLLLSGIGVDVREDPESAGRLQFFATREGEASTISINNLDTSNNGVTLANLNNVLNLTTGVTIPGSPAVSNGYAAQSVDVVQPDGTTQTVEINASASAAAIAAQFNRTSVPGVSASASSVATLESGGFINTNGNLNMTLNGIAVASATFAELADAINTSASLPTVTAAIDAATGDLVVTESTGADLVFAIESSDALDRVVVANDGTSVTLDPTLQPAASVGGAVQFTLDEGVRLANASPSQTNVFGSLAENNFVEVVTNTFDPANQETYNSATSVTIYDSLGNPHVMTQYFVKERPNPVVPGADENVWTMYVQIDGEDIGDPDTSLPPPRNTLPTPASFRLQFNPDGTLNQAGSDEVLISNWIPLDSGGQANGAEGPINVINGGALPVPVPPTSSNFELRLNGSSQFGSPFAVTSVQQDGFTTGRIAGIEIESSGLIAARYSNGQSAVLGQVALANFDNVQGLKTLGNSKWTQSIESGDPLVGSPSTGALGVITSGALESSNVELTEELVALIVAQRNFQANARTISTADEVTQTIINI